MMDVEWADVDLGDLPTWLSTVGTWLSAVGAWLSAVGTIAAVGVAVWLARKEGQRADRAESEQRRAQASRVFAWLEKADKDHTGPESESRDGHFVMTNMQVVVENLSQEPVSDVKVEIVRAQIVRVGGVEGRTESANVFEEWDVLPPRHWLRPAGDLTWKDEPPYVHIQFTDANGQRWERGKGSILTEIGQPDPS